MAKKHPIYRLHKIKVHPNRWFIWTVAYVLVAGIALVGYIKVSEVNLESQVADNTLLPLHSYTDARLGFSVRFPADWAIEADTSSTVTFTPNNSADVGVSVSVNPPSAETAIRKNLKIASEGRTNLDGVNSAIIRDRLGDTHTETIIMSLHKGRLYVIRGTDNLVKKLALTFHFE